MYPGYERQIAHALSGHGFIGSGRGYVHSFDASSLTAFHQAAPKLLLGLIT